MKKIVVGVIGLFAASSMVFADDTITIDEQEAQEIQAGADEFSSFYLGAGLGWEWLENKGNITDTLGGAVYEITKQKENRFRGLVQLGYQHLFADHFLAGLELSCDFAQKKSSDVYSEGDYMGARIDNKGATPGIFAKIGYAFCGKQLIYVKLGGQWRRARIVDTDRTDGDRSYDANKFVLAGALGYQHKFTKKFSGFGEVTYTGRSKKEGNIDIFGYSTKTGEAWGVNLGVAYHLITR